MSDTYYRYADMYDSRVVTGPAKAGRQATHTTGSGWSFPHKNTSSTRDVRNCRNRQGSQPRTGRC